MLAIKNVIFLFSILVSFLFPSERTLFLALAIVFATCFCEYYDYKNNVTHPSKAGKLAATYLGAFSFFEMLLCAALTIFYSIKVLPLKEYFITDSQSTVLSIVVDTGDKLANVHFILPYWIFFFCITAWVVVSMLVVFLLKSKDSQLIGIIRHKYSFQDILDGPATQLSNYS